MPSPEDAALLGGYGEAIEARRIEAERKWGLGRLERLAALGNTELLAKFRRQQATWGAAYEAAWNAPFVSRDALQAVTDKAGAMQRAWAALEAWATEAGHRPVAPWVWEALLRDGTVIALVEDDAAASKVIHEGRHLAVYTANEVANLNDAIPEALKLAKQVWTGAKFKGADLGQRADSGWVEEGDAIPIPFDDPEIAPPGGRSQSRQRAVAAAGGKPIGDLPPQDAAPRELSLAPKPPAVVAGAMASIEDDFA